MMFRAKCFVLLCFWVSLSGSACAFYRDGCSGTRVNTTSVATTPPTGVNNGDLVILVGAAYRPSVSQNAITLSGGTGTWTTNLASPWHGGDAQLIVVSHIYQSGDTFPTLIDGGQTTYFSYIACGYYGAAGIDNFGYTTTPNNTTINFPSMSPSQSNEEALFVGAIGAGDNPTFSNPSTLNTCSTLTDQVSTGKSITSSDPSMSFYQANLGQCAPASIGTQAITASSPGDSIGVTILLTPAPFSSLRHPLGTDLFANNMGTAYYLPNPPPSLDLPVLGLSWLDVIAIYSAWAGIEPNNCDEYAWDYLDNMILNARTLGLKISLSVAGGNLIPCGSSNEASCTGFKQVSNVPAWAFTSTACDGNHAMVLGHDYINSMWIKSWGPPTGNVNLILDPANAYYQQEWDRAISAIGQRYSSIANNITSVKVTGINKDTGETTLNNGTDGSSITCDGTSGECTAICGSPGCSRTLNDASQWLAIGSGYTTSTFIPNDLEAAQLHFESSWHSAFPNAALMASTTTKPSPPGTFVTNDTFNSDMFINDLNNYPYVMEEMNSGLGWSTSGNIIFTAPYLPFSSQPKLAIAFQTVAAEGFVAGAQCASNGLYSTSDTQCVTPSVNAALPIMAYPYIEFYSDDWDDPTLQPWLKLVHDRRRCSN
jgi:hypothetical protein